MFNVAQGQNLFYLLTSVTPTKKGQICHWQFWFFALTLLWKVEQVLPNANYPEPGQGAQEGWQLCEEIVVKKKNLETAMTRHGNGEVHQRIVPEVRTVVTFSV